MKPMDAVSALARTSLAGPDTKTSGELAQKNQNVDEYKNATKPVFTADPIKAEPSPKDRVNPKARYGARSGEQRIDTNSMTKPLGSFEKGTSHVPKTGVYKLHEGEAVIPKDKNMDNKVSAMMHDGLGGEGKKPKKEIHKIETHKTADGKMVHIHKHHHPEHHPDEEHVSNDMAELHKHMEDHMGAPNEGEAAPADGSAPAPMTAAPSPMPAPPAGGAGQ